MFSFITKNWRGRPLTSYQVIVDLVAATTTEGGLRILAEWERGDYPKGIQVSDAQLAALPFVGHKLHPEWNHGLKPEGSRWPTRASNVITASKQLAPTSGGVAIPQQARWRLEQRLELRRRERWPALHDLKVRYRGDYAYVTGADPTAPSSSAGSPGPAHPRTGGSPAGSPEATATRSPSGPPEASPAPLKTPSTASAASTSPTPQPGLTDSPKPDHSSRGNFRARPLRAVGRTRCVHHAETARSYER